MNPNQDQNGQQPPYGVNSAPQQGANGQYDVLPPPSTTGRPTGHNPYEFIVADNSKKKKLLIPGANSFFGKLALMVGGFVVLLVIAGVILSMVFSGNSATADLTATALTQQELIRIAGSSNASKQSVKDVAASVQLSTGSDQKKLLNYLASHGTKLTPKELALGKDAKSDQLLASAKATNTYDDTLLQVMSDDLTAYQVQLQATFKKATSKTLKADLQKYYSTTVLLAEQLKTAQTN